MGRHNSFSGGDPRYTTHLISSHRLGQEEGYSKDGYAGSLLNIQSALSVRNGVLLYKELIRPIMDYACPAWRSAARIHVRRLQVLQSKCLRLATGAYCYERNRQIHDDLDLSTLCRPHQKLDSKLADVGNPLVRQIGRYVC